MTSAQLKAAVDNLVGEADTVFDSNENRPGRWKELADAAEALAGETISANDNIAGYMKRATVALEILGGTSGAEENTTYFGYLKRMVDALEAWNGAVGTGSLTDRFRAAGLAFTTALTNQEATDLVARMSVAPLAVRSRKIDTLVGDLKTAGVWTKLDILYITAAHSEQAAKLNWVADAFNLTDPGATAPAFVIDKGFSGDGTADYLDTGFNPATAPTPKFVQDSAHQSVWCLTNVSSSTQYEGGSTDARINARNGANAIVRMNSATGLAIPVSTSIGWTCANRALAATLEGVRDLGTPASGASVSAAPLSLPFYLCAAAAVGPVPSQFSARQIAAFSCGSSLTDTERDAMYNALLTYMQAVTV